jgi:hypothetical protein
MGVWVFYTLFVLIAFAWKRSVFAGKVNTRDHNHFRSFWRWQNNSRQNCWQRNSAGVLLKPTIFIRRQISKRCAAVIR